MSLNCNKNYHLSDIKLKFSITKKQQQKLMFFFFDNSITCASIMVYAKSTRIECIIILDNLYNVPKYTEKGISRLENEK